MAPFDPYHKWLAIPPAEQPPNHYRLLAIPLLETDADVIEGAAEQRTIYLRTFQTGPNSELAERLLNEVSTARVCLLDGKSKAKYDTRLRKEQQPKTAVPSQTPKLATAQVPKVAAAETAPRTRRSASDKSTIWYQTAWAAAAGGALVMLLVMLIFGSGGTDTKDPGKTTGKQSQQLTDTTEKVSPLQVATRAVRDKAAVEKAIAQSVRTLKGPSDGVLKMAFSPDKKWVISGSLNSTNERRLVKVWDTKNGQEVLTLIGHSTRIDSVTFSPDGKRVMSGSYDNTIKVWDVHNGRELRTLKGHTATIRSVAFSPDGKRIVSGSWDKMVKLWDAETGQVTLTLKGHSDRVESVSFSPDGSRIVSGSRDKTVKVWDSETGKVLRTLKGHSDMLSSAVFNPAGNRIVSAGNDKTVKVWDAETGQEMLTLNGHSSAVRRVAFSPDGKRIASGGHDKTVKVWDAETGQEILTLKGHSGELLSVAFSPDGKRIFSGSADHTVKIWNLGAALTQPTAKSLPDSLQEGLVAYYPFNGNANDESGNGNHGKQETIFTSDRFGNTQRAIQIDKDKQLKISISALPVGNSPRTIIYWMRFKVEELMIVPLLYGKHREMNSCYFLIEPRSRRLFLGEYWGKELQPDTQIIVESGKWYHVALVHDGKDTTFAYVNGREAVRRTAKYSTSPSTSLFLNFRFNHAHSTGQGAMDDLFIFNRALSTAEVKSLYEFEKP